jgi:uncharacterized protein YciU (UPF0263 family)
MSPKKAALMDALGLKYDRTGNDLINNANEWQTAIDSLEKALSGTAMLCGMLSTSMPSLGALVAIKTSLQMQQLADMITEAKAQQLAAKESGGCTLMSPKMAAFMDAMGLKYDRTGTDLINTANEWQPAIDSLETALTMNLMGQGIAMLGGTSMVAFQAATRMADLAEALAEAKEQQRAAKEGRGDSHWTPHHSMMSPKTAALMDSLGLKYDRTGNDLINNANEWQTAIDSLEKALVGTALLCGMTATTMPPLETLIALKASMQMQQLAEMLAEAKTQQQSAEDSGGCTVMSRKMMAFMDALGLEYDRTGNDRINNAQEWGVAVESLEKALAEKMDALQDSLAGAMKLGAMCDFWLSGGAARFLDNLQ